MAHALCAPEPHKEAPPPGAGLSAGYAAPVGGAPAQEHLVEREEVGAMHCEDPHEAKNEAFLFLFPASLDHVAHDPAEHGYTPIIFQTGQEYPRQALAFCPIHHIIARPGH